MSQNSSPPPLKRILQLVVTACQRTRSVLDENNWDPEYSYVHSPEFERLMNLWNMNEDPTLLEVANAIIWIQRRCPAAALTLAIDFIGADLPDFTENTIMKLYEWRNNV